MNTHQKIIIAISIIFVIAAASIGAWLYFNTQKTPQPSATTNQGQGTTQPSGNTPPSGDGTPIQRSTEELTTYLVDNEKSLINPSTNLPVFTVVATKQPLPGWYVMTLRHTTEDTSDATIILRDINGKLTKVAGPGTGLFDDTSLPAEVRKAAREE